MIYLLTCLIGKKGAMSTSVSELNHSFFKVLILNQKSYYYQNYRYNHCSTTYWRIFINHVLKFTIWTYHFFNPLILIYKYIVSINKTIKIIESSIVNLKTPL